MKIFNICVNNPEIMLELDRKIVAADIVEVRKNYLNARYFFFENEQYYLIESADDASFVSGKKIFKFTDTNYYLNLIRDNVIIQCQTNDAKPADTQTNSIVHQKTNLIWALLPLIVGGSAAGIIGTTILPTWIFWSLVASPVVANAKILFESNHIGINLAYVSMEQESQMLERYSSYSTWKTKCFRFFSPALVGISLIGIREIMGQQENKELYNAVSTGITGAVSSIIEVSVDRIRKKNWF